jgi:hypothetical protein
MTSLNWSSTFSSGCGSTRIPRGRDRDRSGRWSSSARPPAPDA